MRHARVHYLRAYTLQALRSPDALCQKCHSSAAATRRPVAPTGGGRTDAVFERTELRFPQLRFAVSWKAGNVVTSPSGAAGNVVTRLSGSSLRLLLVDGSDLAQFVLRVLEKL